MTTPNSGRIVGTQSLFVALRIKRNSKRRWRTRVCGENDIHTKGLTVRWRPGVGVIIDSQAGIKKRIGISVTAGPCNLMIAEATTKTWSGEYG
jgi:hypothetical protein